MSVAEPLSHDLFLLMLNLSQLHDQGRIVQVFIEAINSRELGVRLAYARTADEAGDVAAAIATADALYGYIRFDGAVNRVSADVMALLRNAVRMLALVLQNRRQEAVMREFNESLEEQVQQRTAELCEANEALRQSELRLATALSGAQMGLWDYVIPTAYCYYSPQWFSMLGYQPEELPHTYETWAALLHPDDREHCEKFLHEFVADSQRDDYTIEFRMQAKNGDWRWIRARGQAFERDAQGTVVRMIGTHVDVTQRRRNEEEREKLESQLRHSQKMEAVGRLAGGVAHDFNNILTAILGNIELASQSVAEDAPRAQLLEALGEIERSAQRAAGLTRQLLAFSRRQTARLQILDINSAVAEMGKMLHRLLTEDIRLALHLAPHAALIRADAGQIEQVIMNLVVNARDAMPNGGELGISTSRVRLDEQQAANFPGASPGPYVLLEIADTGCGMDAHTREHLFEPFFTTKHEGTGLGLATVYGIIKQAGGFISVRSEPDQGTTIQIHFPVHTTGAAAKRPDSTKTRPRSGDETILFCEDDHAIRLLAEQFLRSGGYVVYAVSEAHDACRLAVERADEIDLLVTDVIMPDMNGRQVAEAVRAAIPDIRTLFISGYTADVIAPHGVLDEGVEFLEKPFTRDDLLRRVRETLDSRSTAHAARSSEPHAQPQ